MRKAPALLLSAGLLAVALTGCAPGGADACEPTTTDGTASKLIGVSGDFGSAPDVDMPTPLKASETERSTIIDGDGPVISGDQLVQMSFALYNGTTGDPIEQAPYGEPGVYLPSQLLPGMADALHCASVGSRIAVAIPSADGFGADGAAAGISEDDTVVMVADITDAFLAKANGADRPIVESGFPSVVTAADGTPGLTIPKSDPPADLKVAVLKDGDGEKVTKTGSMVVHYTGVLWSEQTIFDSSWEKGVPTVFSADGIIPGLATALVGQQVGSQVLVVIPPELGYGEQGSGAVPADATLVFVVDILGTMN
ncbi:peptidylprolyl isomerase [Mycetocola sp. CAN_C7]|uniref:FKBP-type peptidyl-prolyl cis-trans isomerase n=1 Tax=Mycetocola sp. CAN_C7 TaxID=2787724 RepID=UPI0018CB5E0D